MTFQEALQEIARKNETTPEEVEAAMREAIAAAYANMTPEIREMRQKIRCKGDVPTPEEFVTQVASLLWNEIV